MRVVLDASVMVKWLLRQTRTEGDSERAAEIFEAVAGSAIDLVEPPHWLTEVAGGLARLSPASAEADVLDLVSLELEIVDSVAVYQTAVRLAVDLDQHLFDTLYHAVALDQSDAVLVTADDRYYRAAHHVGRIARLSEWPSGDPPAPR
ncbi:MAG: type II toxin-antitoxin system VapC family toxin [Gemmatimonadota bacterium]